MIYLLFICFSIENLIQSLVQILLCEKSMMCFKLSRGHWALGLLFLTLSTSYSWIQKPNSKNKSLPIVLSTH